MDSNLVSIVVPIYNTEKYLDRCIESIVNQTHKDLEILLIDDGSPDACPKICDAWAEKDPRIRVIHKENQGLGMARNTGIDNARGDYICFVDSDDYLETDALETLFRLMPAENPDIVMFGFFKEGEKADTSTGSMVYSAEEITRDLLPEIISSENRKVLPGNVFLSACTALFSMEMIRRVGWRFASERKIISEDVYALLELFQWLQKVVVLPKGMYHYCENQTSLTHTYRPDRFQKTKVFYQACMDLCRECGYSKEVELQCGEPFVSFVITALRQEMAEKDQGQPRRVRIKQIVEDPVLQRVLRDRKNIKTGIMRRVLFWAMRNKLYDVCCLLLTIRNKM